MEPHEIAKNPSRPQMKNWLDCVQHFITDECEDSSMLSTAASLSNNPELANLLNSWPIEKPAAIKHAQQVIQNLSGTNDAASILLQVLLFTPALAALELSHQEPEPSVVLTKLIDLAEQCTTHKKLQAVQAYLYKKLAIYCWEVGHFSQAYDLLTSALPIYRCLLNEDAIQYKPELAMVLNRLGAICRALYKDFEAKSAYSEALALYQQLAEINMETYRQGVANTLNNLGVLAYSTHDCLAAKKYYQEALALYRDEPDGFPSAVANTQHNLGNVLSDDHDWHAAHASYKEALRLRQEFAKIDPEVFQLEVADTLLSISDLLRREGDYSAAIQSVEEAEELYRDYIEQFHVDVRPELARCHNFLASVVLQTN